MLLFIHFSSVSFDFFWLADGTIRLFILQSETLSYTPDTHASREKINFEP
jgi:hypothetical protein